MGTNELIFLHIWLWHYNTYSINSSNGGFSGEVE